MMSFMAFTPGEAMALVSFVYSRGQLVKSEII